MCCAKYRTVEIYARHLLKAVMWPSSWHWNGLGFRLILQSVAGCLGMTVAVSTKSSLARSRQSDDENLIELHSVCVGLSQLS